MSEIKRGVVMLLQAGDPEISGTIAEGILAGRREATATAGISSGPAGRLPQRGRPLAAEERREIARRVKEAVGNTRTPSDYAMLRFKAEVAYGESVYEPTRLERALEKVLTLYALAVYQVDRFYRREESRWRGN